MNSLVTRTLPVLLGTDVHILYTSPEGTRAALAVARVLGKDLGIVIRLLAFQVVPPRLSMTDPPIAPEFAVNEILRSLKPCDLSNVTVEYVLCREKKETILRWVTKPATVVLGGRNSIFRSEEMRLARY